MPEEVAVVVALPVLPAEKLGSRWGSSPIGDAENAFSGEASNPDERRASS
jgi:hypothetical protein